MELRQPARLVAVNGKLMTLTIVAWWSVVLAITALISKAMTEETLRKVEEFLINIPVVEKYSHHANPEYTVGLFYVVFVLINPLVIFIYIKIISVRGVFNRSQISIFALLITAISVGLVFGFDVSGGIERSFRGLVRLVLGVSWVGPSLVFLLLFHCLNFVIALMFNRRK